MSNAAAIALLEQRIRAEESIIKSNLAVVLNAKALLKAKDDILTRSIARVTELEKAIELEKASVAKEVSRLEQNIVLRKVDVQNSEKFVIELKDTLALLKTKEDQ